jgi:hypothetical protein
MGKKDQIWYREMMEKEADKRKASDISLENKIDFSRNEQSNKFPIWKVIIVVTLILWITLFMALYIIPLAKEKREMEALNTALEEANADMKKSFDQIDNSINSIIGNTATGNYQKSKSFQGQATSFLSSKKSLPINGYNQMFYSQNNAVATFKIIADPNHHYYVKLTDHFDNPKLLIFVRAGEITKVRVPLGTYELNWTCGEKWYGDKELFGSSTVFRKAVGVLNFAQEETKLGNKIIGNTINFNQIRSDTPLIKITVNEF